MIPHVMRNRDDSSSLEDLNVVIKNKTSVRLPKMCLNLLLLQTITEPVRLSL